MRRGLLPLFVAVLTLTGVSASAEGEAPAAPAPFSVDGLERGWYAGFRTSMGDFLVRLLPEQSPQAVAHFAALAEGRLPWNDPVTGETKQGRYYDGLLVHKVEDGRRFESGDPTATGRGAPRYYVPAEGFGPVNFSRPFVVGMTRAPLGKISGVQFFVTSAPEPYLSPRHPCFGEVVGGREVVSAITGVQTNAVGQPLEQILIESVVILAAGDPFPLPEPERYEPKVLEFGPREDRKK